MSTNRTEFEAPKVVEPPELSALWGDFVIYDNGNEWLIACRSVRCKARWSLRKTPLSAGNILSLINHAGSHE